MGYLDRRRPIMQWWGEHIEQSSQRSHSATGTANIKLAVLGYTVYIIVSPILKSN